MNGAFHKPLRIAFTKKSPVGTPVSEDDKYSAVEKIAKRRTEEGHIVAGEQENDVDGSS